VVWWILLGGFVLGVLLLAVVVRPVLTRLPALERALRGLERRAREAQDLRPGAEELQGRLAALQERTERMAAARAAEK
jgi:type VI protein secretion system component VasK